MMKDLHFSDDEVEALFPCKGEEGQDVQVSQQAVVEAAQALGVPLDANILWHTPDVFAVRYGSSFVASAQVGDLVVRFHGPDGDFREGDAK
jgi:hypothetical protein